MDGTKLGTDISDFVRIMVERCPAWTEASSLEGVDLAGIRILMIVAAIVE